MSRLSLDMTETTVSQYKTIGLTPGNSLLAAEATKHPETQQQKDKVWQPNQEFGV